MKTILKLILIYFAAQLFFTGAVSGILMMINDYSLEQNVWTASIWGLLLSCFALGYYLIQKRYVDRDQKTWAIPSTYILILTLGLTFSSVFLLDGILSFLPLPDFLAESFEELSRNVIGVLTIVLFGPILEELLFRGAIQRILMTKYNPNKAIFISALIFGIIHLNPIQVVFAFLMGLLLGWLYYKTGSLVPSISMHVVTNLLSTVTIIFLPDVDNLYDVVGNPSIYFLYFLLAGIVFTFCEYRIYLIGKED